MTELILLGGGGHCESVIEVINGIPDVTIRGILDPTYNGEEEKTILGIPILGDDEQIGRYASEGCQFVITVGQIKSAKIREKLYARVKLEGAKLPIITTKTSYISSTAKIDEGTVVMHKSFINANAVIGKCAIVNTGALIEHGSHIGDFCHISTGSIINGNVKCGNQVFIGSGSIINQDIKIGNNVVIASGSLVRNEVKDNSMVYGNPIKRIR